MKKLYLIKTKILHYSQIKYYSSKKNFYIFVKGPEGIILFYGLFIKIFIQNNSFYWIDLNKINFLSFLQKYLNSTRRLTLKPIKKILYFNSLGFKFLIKKNSLMLFLGFSHRYKI